MPLKRVKVARTGSASSEELASFVDLDLLRGWKERRIQALRAEHQLRPLARLIHVDHDGVRRTPHLIHGPDVLAGRFQAQYAPVDIVFPGLRDFENYRLGAPHLHLLADEGGEWAFQTLSSVATTFHNGTLIEHGVNRHRLESGAELRLGAARFIFEYVPTSLASWRKSWCELLDRTSEASLFLMRRGAICGPYFELDQTRPNVIGRSAPASNAVAGTRCWPEFEPLSWDLAGLYDAERKYIAFRHLRISFSRDRGQWLVEPLSTRQTTFINRARISEPTPLAPGDQLGLGSIVFYFHHPERGDRR